MVRPNRDDMLTCVHCGANYLDRPFKRVPTSAHSALTLACVSCFSSLPADIVATPTLDASLAVLQDQMESYANAVRYMRGVDSVAPPWILSFNQVKVTHDTAGADSTQSP